MESVISIEKLTKKFNDRVILENLDMDIEHERITSIMGRSGCGKTTLLRIISGLDKEYEGKIKIGCNKSVNDIAFMFQEDRLIENISIYKNLEIVSKSGDKKYIRYYLEKFDLYEQRNQNINCLSGGMKRKVALIRSIILDKDILFFDEPFNGIDKNSKEKIIEYIKEYQKKEKKTIVIITHDLNDAKILSDKIIEISKMNNIK